MHAKIQCLILHRFLTIKFFKIWVIGILYNAIMHNMKFGQIHCVDLLKKIHTKFTLYFSSISTNFYLISKFGSISVN
jgi:hypothetical protein